MCLGKDLESSFTLYIAVCNWGRDFQMSQNCCEYVFRQSKNSKICCVVLDYGVFLSHVM
jgi:hypothetical protein